VIEDYQWRNLRNAVGFATTCARHALQRHLDAPLDEARRLITIAEKYVGDLTGTLHQIKALEDEICGEGGVIRGVPHPLTHEASYAAYSAYATTATLRHAYFVRRSDCHATACRAVSDTIQSGVDRSTIDRYRLTWILRDLGLTENTKTYNAAHAALLAGSLVTAHQIARIE